MTVRIFEKILISAAAIVLMAACFADNLTTLVLIVLMSLMGVFYSELFRGATASYVFAVVVILMMLMNPCFALLMIPSAYGLVYSNQAGAAEFHVMMRIKNRISEKNVYSKTYDVKDTISKTEILYISAAFFIICVQAVLSLFVLDETEMHCRIAPLIFSLIAVVMALREKMMEKLEQKYLESFDKARKEQLDAEANRNRIAKQSEDNVYMATLQERNRIAREIHDNVGHMLTRAIVQMQAIKVINRDENIKPHLDSVDETINTAMLGIRRSVHELHDESIDLSIMLNEIVKTLPENFKVDCRTSIESATDNELKNTILGIVRESITNIAKHSTGDKVRVEIIEHAAFWRVLVHDNGNNKKMDYSRMLQQRESGSGLGLVDIAKRAERLKGTTNITSDENGFSVLVIIPKQTS